MNGVNLLGRALCTCGDDTLWNRICYPLPALEPAASNALLSSLFLLPPPSFSRSLRLSWSVPFFSSSSSVFRSWNRTGSISAGGRRWSRNPPQLPPTISSLPPPSPPSSHPQFTQHAAVLIHRRDFACNFHGDPLPGTEQAAFAVQYTFGCIVGC